jgi:outer membrane protein OmpA-like peptidoglycan-associated protein
MKKLSTLLLSLICGTVMLNAQVDSEHNLVPNPSFEEVDKKIKDPGMITLAEPWKSVTMNPVDLYSEDARNDDFGVPENAYGKEKAKTGTNYAGVAFFGYRGRKPRTYLGTELKKPLEAGKEYCLKFHVSLSDMSKYAVNNIAMYIAKEEITEPSEANLTFKPQIQSITNKVFEQQFLWKPICGKFTAEGGEKFIVIGNFKPDDNTTQEKIKLSREFSGRQTYDAYYFVDDVSVIPTDEISEKDCICDKIAGGQMEVEYKTFGTDEEERKKAKETTFINSDGSKAGEEEKEAEATTESEDEAPAEKEEKKGYNVNDVNVFFPSKKFAVITSEQAKLQKIADYMQENPNVKLEIIGHGDASEADVAFIGKRRGLAVQKEMESLGVAANRLSFSSQETSQPHPSGKTFKNQRVTFNLK